MLLCVMPETYFDVWPRAFGKHIRPFKRVKHREQFQHKRICLQPGELIVFRGDLVHAGAPFANFNVRVHIFLDHPHIPRRKDSTFFIDLSKRSEELRQPVFNHKV